MFDKLPISAFVWKKPEEDLPLTELQLWDCFSYDITVVEKQMLKGISVNIYHQVRNDIDSYMFTIDNANSTNLERNVTYSEVPTQHKSFNIIKLERSYFELNQIIE